MANNLTNQVRNIATVTTAVANGDLTQQITVDAQGEILELKDTINRMVAQLSTFAAEVTRVAREVGTEGILGGQAAVEGVSGTWKDLTDSVNSMASNLTGQVRNIAEVTTAVARGDLARQITVDVRGEFLELKNTINTMVDQLGTFAVEVTRVAREVGSEGILGGQAAVEGMSGTWKDLTDSVNFMAANLTNQVRNIADVTTAVANGDLGRQVTVDARGEILELRNTINRMVDQLSTFAAEVTRVAREVGTEGILGGQAAVEGVSGTWKDLTDSVNSMASNLTGQVRNIAEVTTAVANGDLSRQITVDVRGEFLELKNTINRMVGQLNTFASEVTRVAREVGTEGILGGQAEVVGVGGTWKDLTDSVNSMANNLTIQVRNIAEVTTAVARGDLTRQITVDARGEILSLKDTINTMVDQLGTFAAEVTRVAREVGTEGKLGGQAAVEGVSGTWKDLTDSVNSMASNLTGQVRNIAEVTIAVAQGDLSRKITVDVRGEFLQLKDTMNTMVDQLNSFAAEVTRVAREVGQEGRLGGQANVPGVAGTWKDLTDSVNMMANNLTSQVRNIATVTTAVANGDLTRQITVDVRGEMLELKETINTMVEQLNSFGSEVTRVAREVGTEGKLGGQATVRGVSGVWKDLTDNVNLMAANLTDQVRGIAQVVTAVANGDLKRRLTVEARGEIAALADTINSMTDTLAIFADQVTTVAREVGVEGKLGGQANVPGAAGTWRDLTDNVNGLAANLTTQVRAIADVATAVTKGDLTRTVTVSAAGEVAALSSNINEMIRNLRDTTRANQESDWLNSNLARFSRLLQGQRDLTEVSRLILSELAQLANVQHGVFFINEPEESQPVLRLQASYGYTERKNLSKQFRAGEGLVGQCVFEKQRILLTQVPDDYVKIGSGLGEGTPMNISVLPILFEQELLAVMELASFSRFTDVQLSFLDQLAESIGIVLNTIAATARTEELLRQSQTMAAELQTQQEELSETNKRLEEQARTLQASEERLKEQQEELQQTNEELGEKARLLAEQNVEVEQKNAEVEGARQELTVKADQLALTSKYKSEFLANMSHELRTPLNSMLILSDMLKRNDDGNLTEKQVDFAATVHSSGADLLALINDILDLSKIESGAMEVELEDVLFARLRDEMDRTFRPVAEGKGLTFSLDLDPLLPAAVRTDAKRLAQVVKNLLSNAFKFTSQGGVSLRVSEAKDGWSRDHESLNAADRVIGFAVTDSGVGIPEDKQRIIFEAFQQADGTTSRKYGGTGLGLSISREIAQMLGGELCLTRSAPDEGSTFTLFLPQSYQPRAGERPVGPEGSVTSVGSVGSVGSVRSVGSVGPGPAAPPPRSQREAVLTAPVVADDRADLKPGDRKVLIIEDDVNFARILLDQAREKGFKALVATTGEQGLALAKQFRPDAVTLDLRLPEADGLTVLDLLKHDPELAHVPVHVISVVDERQRSLTMGAVAHLVKPVSKDDLDAAFSTLAGMIERPVSKLLVVEDAVADRQAVVELIGNGDVETTAVATAEEALTALQATRFDCMVLDLMLPDMSGFELIDKMKQQGLANLPIIVHTAKDLTADEETQLREAAESIIVKGVAAPERLLAETALFLHRVESRLPEEKRKMLERLHQKDPTLAGKKVLCVDDDVRNIFALTSILERQEMTIVPAENGRAALERLQDTPGIDLVLMDIMMPEMDGYETMQEVRKLPQFAKLPIIALTAKAMKGDRERCLEAGASDYIPKPVDPEKLVSLMRVWLYR
jgi:HAMP domain-containing protein/signal transduction histidine kinase/DNA-binding response OmpR family regulator